MLSWYYSNLTSNPGISMQLVAEMVTDYFLAHPVNGSGKWK